MPARELGQKVHDVTMEWSRFLADAHRMLNEIEGIGVGGLNSASNMSAIPNPRVPLKQQMDTVAQLTARESTRLREAIQKLRSYMTI